MLPNKRYNLMHDMLPNKRYNLMHDMLPNKRYNLMQHYSNPTRSHMYTPSETSHGEQFLLFP